MKTFPRARSLFRAAGAALLVAAGAALWAGTSPAQVPAGTLPPVVIIDVEDAISPGSTG